MFFRSVNNGHTIREMIDSHLSDRNQMVYYQLEREGFFLFTIQTNFEENARKVTLNLLRQLNEIQFTTNPT